MESETRIQGKPIYLGVLGTHTQITKQEIHEKILHPLMSVLGRLPDTIIFPSDGLSSELVSQWAERNRISTHCVQADWKKFQRKAGILRDARIVKESTHLLVFGGVRSKTNEQTAIKQAKKGKQVFLVEPNPIEMCEIVVIDDD